MSDARLVLVDTTSGKYVINLDLISLAHPIDSGNTTEVEFATGSRLQLQIPFDRFLEGVGVSKKAWGS